MRNLTEDFEKIILTWLKSDNENVTIPAYECNKLAQCEVDLCNKQSVNASYLLGREDALNDIKGTIERLEKEKTEECEEYKCLVRATNKNVLGYEKYLDALMTLKLCVFSNLKYTVFRKR